MYLTTTVKGGRTQILHHAAVGRPARAVTSVTDSDLAVQLADALNRVEKAPDSGSWWSALDTLREQLPSAVNAAVLDEVGRYAAGTERTWTFFGHWDGSRIVVEYSLPGEVADERPDTGFWPDGLWCDSGSGRTEAEARARAVAEYEAEYSSECPVCDGTHQALPAGDEAGAKQLCWYCKGEPL